jgi:hypothetical protein
VSPGTHFIAVKFIKDGSGNNGNDSVRLRLKSPLSSAAINRIAKADRDLTPEHIVDGVEIFGVRGTFTSLDPNDLVVQNVNVGSPYDLSITMEDPNEGESYGYRYSIPSGQDISASKIARGQSVLGISGTYKPITYY